MVGDSGDEGGVRGDFFQKGEVLEAEELRLRVDGDVIEWIVGEGDFTGNEGFGREACLE